MNTTHSTCTPHRSLARAGLVVGLFFTVFLCDPHLRAADPAVRTFDIAAGEAIVTLKEFMTQADTPLLYSVSAVDGVATNAVHGRFTATEALHRMVANTALSVANDQPGGTLTLSRVRPEAMSEKAPGAATSERGATAPATPARDEVLVMDVFKVSNEGSTGYGVSTSSAATRLNTPLRDIPQSINVVTERLLADTFSYTLSDAFRYLPNVSRRSVTHTPNEVFIRGFLVSTIFQDGFRIFNAHTDLANIERIEIIKGPASAISGRGEVGGSINFITKRAEKKAKSDVNLSLGSYDFYRVRADSTGPLNEAATLRYRVSASFQHSGTEVPFDQTKKVAVFPRLEWDISPRTALTYSASLIYADVPQFTGAGVFVTSRTAGNPAGLVDQITPRDLNMAEPYSHRIDKLNWHLFTLTHQFNDHFTFRQGLQFGSLDGLRIFGSSSSGVLLEPGTGDILVRRNYQKRMEKRDQVYLQGEVVSKFRLLGGDHVTLFGYEYGDSVDYTTFLQAPLDPINIVHPKYPAIPGITILTLDTTLKAKSYGFPIQYQGSFFDGWVKAMAGIRYDKSVTDQTYLAGGVNRSNSGLYTGSPRFGLTLAPLKWLSIYGVHSKDKQQPVTQARFNLLKPGDPRISETITGARDGTLNEGGVKAEVFGGRLSVTASYFHIRRIGQVTGIGRVADDGSQYSESFFGEGEAVRGYEVQVFGGITPRLELVASYAHSKSSAILGTQRLFITSLPDYDFSTFLKYSFHDPDKDGFNVRAGYKKIGSMWGTVDNLFRLPPQHKTDVGVGYKRGAYKVDLQVNNVTDENFIESAAIITVITYTPARQVTLSVTRSF